MFSLEINTYFACYLFFVTIIIQCLTTKNKKSSSTFKISLEYLIEVVVVGFGSIFTKIVITC